MSKKVKAAVIGLGVGVAHSKGYQANPDAELAAICDIDPVRLQQRGEMLGIPEELRFIKYQDMLKEVPDLDVVSVAVPNYLHAPITIDCLRAGKNVLCEKPISVNSANARNMIAEAKASGKQLMVCFNYRFREDARWLKSLIDEGRMGEIYFARAGWQRNQGIPGFGGWFTTKALSGGGPLIDLSVHVLDLTLFMMGYPKPVSVSGAAFGKFGQRGRGASSAGFGAKEADDPTKKPAAGTFDVEDYGAGFVRFENGAALQLEASWASQTKPGKDDYFVTLYGTEGGADLYVANYTATDTITFYTEECGQPVAITPNIVNRVSPHQMAVAHIVECVKNNRPVEATGAQGLTLIRIIEGVYESAQTGKEVRLD